MQSASFQHTASCFAVWVGLRQVLRVCVWCRAGVGARARAVPLATRAVPLATIHTHARLGLDLGHVLHGRAVPSLQIRASLPCPDRATPLHPSTTNSVTVPMTTAWSCAGAHVCTRTPINGHPAKTDHACTRRCNPPSRSSPADQVMPTSKRA